MQRYWSLYLTPDAGADDPLAFPLRAADLRGLPPACILTAEYDVLRDEGEAYAARLDAAGVPVRLRRFAGLSHSFLHMLGAVDAAKAAMDEAGAWLRETAGA